MWNTVDLSADDDFSIYLRSASVSACPFIKSSAEQKLLFFRAVEVVQQSKPKETEYIIFRESVAALRDFLSTRSRLEPQLQGLLCFNVIFREISGASLEQEFFIPHFLLKLAFTSCDVIFGKFWVGEVIAPRRGSVLRSCGVNFLSIRSLQDRLDNRFFIRSPHLLECSELPGEAVSAQQSLSFLSSALEAEGIGAYIRLLELNASALAVPK